MKFNKPFQKGFVCGSILLIVTLLFLFAILENQELYYLKWGQVFAASFLPAAGAAMWASLSKRNWTWVRFILVVVIFYPFCITGLIFCSRFIPEKIYPLPKISFSPDISPSWTIKTGAPITSINKAGIGTQLSLSNKDGKRIVWVGAINLNNHFDVNVENWKVLNITRSMKFGFQLLQNKMTQETERGRKTAVLYLSARKDNLTNDIICKAWTDKRFFVTCEALGKNVDVSHDTEIEGIFSSVAVK
jgi:hypothetical protein